MIALRLSVPIACWRKGHAREFMETEVLPPPATCYGALLSLVGEVERERHLGCRVTAGMLPRAERSRAPQGKSATTDPRYEPEVSTVLRTFWRIKSRTTPQGNGENARPDLQQLVLGAELVIFCDSREETGPGPSLEERVTRAFLAPAEIDRFGGWSLGESTHLINDAWLLPEARLPGSCRTFLADPEGEVTLPVWVDHVGTQGTRYAVGHLVEIEAAPERERLPQIFPPQTPSGATTPARRKRAK